MGQGEGRGGSKVCVRIGGEGEQWQGGRWAAVSITCAQETGAAGWLGCPNRANPPCSSSPREVMAGAPMRTPPGVRALTSPTTAGSRAVGAGTEAVGSRGKVREKEGSRSGGWQPEQAELADRASGPKPELQMPGEEDVSQGSEAALPRRRSPPNHPPITHPTPRHIAPTRVFVEGDVAEVASLLHLGACDALGPQVPQHQVVVCCAWLCACACVRRGAGGGGGERG